MCQREAKTNTNQKDKIAIQIMKNKLEICYNLMQQALTRST